MKKLIIIGTLICSTAFAAPLPAPSIPLGQLGAPNGVATLDSTGFPAVSEDKRPPTAFDDFTRGYLPGNGTSNLGPLWQYNGQVWQAPNTTNAYQQYDWTQVAPSVPCDPGTLSVSTGSGGSGCMWFYGMFRGVTAYSGNALTVWRQSDATAYTIPLVPGPSGLYVADQRALNRLCAGAPSNTQRCWVSIWNDQTGAANNLLPTYSGMVKFTAFTSAVGTFTTNSVITLSDTGGTGCTQNTKIAVTAVSAGVPTAGTISTMSECPLATNPLANFSATQASASVTGGGTSVTVTGAVYGYPEAIEYNSYILVKGFPAVTCGGQGSGQGNDFLNQKHICSMTAAAGAWTPQNTTWSTIVQQKSATTAINFVTDITNTYGWQFVYSATNTPSTVGMNNKRCNPFVPVSSPSVVTFSTQTDSAYRCFEGNQFFAATAGLGTNAPSTGFILGGNTGSAFSMVDLMGVPAATDADVNVIRIGQTAVSGTVPQGRTVLGVTGGSITFGAGQGDGLNYPMSGNFAYSKEVRTYNFAVSSQQLCNEAANFAIGDALMYDPYADVNIVANVGEMNDIGNSSPSAIHGCRAFLMYQWQQLANGYFMTQPALATATGVSGYVNGDTVTAVPPTGITCTTAPTITVAGVGGPGAGVPGTSSVMANVGWCTGYTGVWTSTGGTGTGATWTFTGLPRSPVRFISGEVPPQCTKWVVQANVNEIYLQYLDITSNLSKYATQPCSTATTCTNLTGPTAGLLPAGMGYNSQTLVTNPGIPPSAINDYAVDPIIGFGGQTANPAFPGPYVTVGAGALYPAGTYPLASGASVPFCQAIYSGTGDHPTPVASRYMWGNLQVVVRSLMNRP